MNYMSVRRALRKLVSVEKMKKWIQRYWRAEVAGTASALFFATVVHTLTKNDILTALAGAYGENLGFYGVMIVRDVHSSRKYHRESGKNYTVTSLLKNIRDIIIEFGPAEVIDSFNRPFMMYLFPKLTGNTQTGIFAGKVAADIVAYIPVVITYELHQKYKNRRKR